MKKMSTLSRGTTLLPWIRTLKSGTSWRAWATALPTRWVGVTRCPCCFARSISSINGVASNSSMPYICGSSGGPHMAPAIFRHPRTFAISPHPTLSSPA